MRAAGSVPPSRMAEKQPQHQNGSCVEVAAASTQGTLTVIAVRDSKNRAGAVLIFSDTDWLAFTTRVKARELDVP